MDKQRLFYSLLPVFLPKGTITAAELRIDWVEVLGNVIKLCLVLVIYLCYSPQLVSWGSGVIQMKVDVFVLLVPTVIFALNVHRLKTWNINSTRPGTDQPYM